MNVYAVIVTMPALQALTESAITTQFPEKSLKVTDSAWFVADKELIFEFSKKLGVMGTEGGTLSNIIVIPINFYWGHGSVATWQWLQSRLEEK
jgi:hypothetical protein